MGGGGKKTYIEPPSFSGSDKKVPKTAQGVFSGDIVLDFGGNWTYQKGEKGSDKDQTFRLKKDYFPKLTITKIYNNQSTVLTKDNKKQNGYEEDHTKGGNYIRLWGCFKDVTNDNKVVQFKFHDGTGTFQDIITTIQKKGDSRYQLLSVEYQDPDGNAGGETGEQFTISFDYDGKHENPESQTVSKGGKVRDPELADVAYWYVKGNLNWKWDFSKSEVKGNRTLVAVLKKELPVESEIWLCKPKGYEKKYVSVLYQYDEDGKEYIQDLKESDNKKVIRTDKEKPKMFFFSMQLEEGENKQRLNSKAYFSSEIIIQRQDENNISIRDYKHLGKLCSVQFQNENGDLINSELPNFKIQEKNNLDTTLTAPIRYIRKGNKITLAPKLEEGYNWVKVETGKPTNQVFTITKDIVDENLVLRAVKKQDKKTFPVSFKSWDGKEDLVDSRAVEEGEKTQAPSVEGIVAWYTKDSSEAATEYNFSDSTITSALVLYGAKGYTITLEDSEGKELGKVKVSDAEPKIPADKLKDYNTEDIEYWYVKGTKDPEKTENQITLADYSATEDVTLIGKKKDSQNNYIEVTLMYQDKSATLNILKGNTIDSAVISEATKDWTDDEVVGGKLKIASWQTENGTSFNITDTKITEHITLVAVPCQKWTVSFKQEGENEPFKTIKVYDGDTITLPEELKEKANKWYLENNEEFRFGTTKITAGTTIIGKKNQTNSENEGGNGGTGEGGNGSTGEGGNGGTGEGGNGGTGEGGNGGTGEGGNGGTGEGGQQPNTSNVSDYTPIFIEPIIESSTAGTATTQTTDNNSVTISDDSTPLSAGEMAKIEGILDSYKEIRMKDIDAKGYNKLIKAYTKAVKKIKSRKGTDKEIAELYKKLQENKKKYVKIDFNIKRIDMSAAKTPNKKKLFALVKKLDEYMVEQYSEKVFSKLFKAYDKAIKALNDKNISDKKLDLVYKNLLTEKKNADRFLKKNK